MNLSEEELVEYVAPKNDDADWGEDLGDAVYDWVSKIRACIWNTQLPVGGKSWDAPKYSEMMSRKSD